MTFTVQQLRRYGMRTLTRSLMPKERKPNKPISVLYMVLQPLVLPNEWVFQTMKQGNSYRIISAHSQRFRLIWSRLKKWQEPKAMPKLSSIGVAIWLISTAEMPPYVDLQSVMPSMHRYKEQKLTSSK